MIEWLGDSAIPDPPEGSPSLTLSPPSPPTIPSPNRGERQAQPSSCKPLLWVTRRLPLRPRLYSSMGGSSGEGRAPRDGAGRTANAGPPSEARRVPSSPGRCGGVGGNVIRLEADSTSNSLGWLLSKKKKKERNPEHSVGENVGKLVGPPSITGGNAEWCSCCEKVGPFFRKCDVELPYDPAIPPQGVYPKASKTGSQRDVCAPRCVAALFTAAKRWKQHKRPLTDGCGVHVHWGMIQP